MTLAVAPDSATTAPAPITLRQAWPFWLKVGFISFGGPAGQIALLHEELVERRRWGWEGWIGASAGWVLEGGGGGGRGGGWGGGGSVCAAALGP